MPSTEELENEIEALKLQIKGLEAAAPSNLAVMTVINTPPEIPTPNLPYEFYAKELALRLVTSRRFA